MAAWNQPRRPRVGSKARLQSVPPVWQEVRQERIDLERVPLLPIRPADSPRLRARSDPLARRRTGRSPFPELLRRDIVDKKLPRRSPIESAWPVGPKTCSQYTAAFCGPGAESAGGRRHFREKSGRKKGVRRSGRPEWKRRKAA